MQWLETFNAQTELSKLGGEGLGLFALALRFGIDDVSSAAADSITDGPDDKKIDILHIDTTLRSAFIMQCYMKSTDGGETAPANKASDLNTAATYVLATPEDQLPKRLVKQIVALRTAIVDEEIDQLFFWFVHNLRESQNVQLELNQVTLTSLGNLNSHFPGKKISIIASEIGVETLGQWFEQSTNKIAVSEEISLTVDGAYLLSTENWSAVVTTVRGRDLFSLYKKHQSDLFSLNVRDYLGLVKKDANVNNNIKATASDEPHNFWAFNNGITAIVNDFEISDDRNFLKIKGISIVNGAQTTGAIGNLESEPESTLLVPARFFKTSKQDMIQNIVKYNNSQNAVEAADFRSTDNVQKRLREEFEKRADADYDGGRRGSNLDAIKRSANRLPNYTVGQVLTAMHGDPVLAYNEKSRIWTDNTPYNRVFNDETTAKHIIFAYSLLRAIEKSKAELLVKSRNSQGAPLEQKDEEKIAYFRQKGSIYHLLFIVSDSLELMLNRPLPNKFGLSFGDLSLSACVEAWHPIVEIVLAFSPKLTDQLSEGLKSTEKSKAAAGEIRQTLDAIKDYNALTYREFADKVVNL